MTTNENDVPLLLTVAVLGGTGKEGSGLARQILLLPELIKGETVA